MKSNESNWTPEKGGWAAGIEFPDGTRAAIVARTKPKLKKLYRSLTNQELDTDEVERAKVVPEHASIGGVS